MRKMVLIIWSLFFFVGTSVNAQKKIVVLGSSTAAGTGATTFDSAWVGKLQLYYQQNTIDGLDTIVTNLAVGGFTTYDVMPSSFTPPSGRPSSDQSHNVTKALSFAPDIILINLPSNDMTNGYTKLETMNNFKLLYQTIVNAGIKCFITTTQPRNNLGATVMQYQRDLVDSITIDFAMYSINFWDDLVTNDGQNMLRPEVNSGDGIHPNNLGHNLLFQKVQAKNIFSINAVLPLSLMVFTAQLQNNIVLLNWRTQSEELNTFFEIQKSNNGIDFEKLTIVNALGTKQGGSYSYTDQYPHSGNNFYRLKVQEPGKNSYSKIVIVRNVIRELFINKLFNSSAGLDMEINSSKNQTVEMSVINLAGIIVEKRNINLIQKNTQVSLQTSNLPSGEYLLHLRSDDGNLITKKFIQLK